MAKPLTVGGIGPGSGTVTSQMGLAPQIYCAIAAGVTSGSCAEQYPSGTSVMLTATPEPGSRFTGWSGACTGTEDCTVTMSDIRNVTATFVLPPVPLVDFDGDSQSDLAVYRPSTGEWWGLLSSNGYHWQTAYLHASWGLAEDVPVAGDYDGDRQGDLMVYRPSTGERGGLLSSNDYDWQVGDLYASWGLAGDVPVAGDYDGDKKADLMVYPDVHGRVVGIAVEQWLPLADGIPSCVMGPNGGRASCGRL